jgi:hypothetical protein
MCPLVAGKVIGQFELAVDLPQQQRPGVGDNRSAGEIRDDLTTGETGKK